MKIDVVGSGTSLTLMVEGELDLATAPILEEALERSQAGDATLVVVNLDQVSFIDSTGLHVLLKYAGPSSQDARRMQLTRGSSQVQRLFEVTGTSDYVTFAD